MGIFRHSIALAAALSVGFVAGCKSKVQQCNAFIEQANASQNEFIGLNPASIQSKEAMKKKAEAIREGKKKVKAVELSDEKLKGFQERWVEGLDAMAEGLEGIDAEDPKAIMKSGKKLQKDGEEMGKLIDEVNSYCQAE